MAFALSELGLSLQDFWDMMPRTLISIIGEWRELSIYKAQISGHIANGGSPDDLRPVVFVDYNINNVL